MEGLSYSRKFYHNIVSFHMAFFLNPSEMVKTAKVYTEKFNSDSWENLCEFPTSLNFSNQKLMNTKNFKQKFPPVA